MKIHKFIENKSPFVTVYATDVLSNNINLEEFVNSEIETIRNDINMKLSESSSLVINNKSAANLVYVDYNGYKHKVIWISSKYSVFRVSYYAEKEQYLAYIASVMEMVNSFRIDEPSVRMSTEKLEIQKSVDVDNPLQILKIRFAKGEITEEQFLRMRSILEE